MKLATTVLILSIFIFSCTNHKTEVVNDLPIGQIDPDSICFNKIMSKIDFPPEVIVDVSNFKLDSSFKYSYDDLKGGIRSYSSNDTTLGIDISNQYINQDIYYAHESYYLFVKSTLILTYFKHWMDLSAYEGSESGFKLTEVSYDFRSSVKRMSREAVVDKPDFTLIKIDFSEEVFEQDSITSYEAIISHYLVPWTNPWEKE